jgi:hypothetical protein
LCFGTGDGVPVACARKWAFLPVGKARCLERVRVESKKLCFLAASARLLGRPGTSYPGCLRSARHMDTDQASTPDPMVAVRTSETLNSRNADDASSNTSSKARTTTAQHQPLADAEPPGVQATTPGDQEGRPSDLRARAYELTENDEDQFMQKGPKRTEFHSVELDASTVVQNRAPTRTIGGAAQTMVQTIASATKMAKQSLWGPPPLLWQAEEAAEGDEMLVRKLEEQLNAVKQRLSLAGSTTSGGSAEGRISGTQRRTSIGASENEHAGAAVSRTIVARGLRSSRGGTLLPSRCPS